LSKILSMSFFGYFLGSMMAGVLLQFTDFAFVFAAVILFNAICIFLTVVFMKESVATESNSNTNEHTVDSGGSTTTKRSSWKAKLVRNRSWIGRSYIFAELAAFLFCELLQNKQQLLLLEQKNNLI